MPRKREATRTTRPRSPRRFYAAVLDAAGQLLLEEAQGLTSLEEEIALLRLRLRNIAAEHPENLPLFLKLMELLVRAVSAQYRLSKPAAKGLQESAGEVMEKLGAVLGLTGEPEEEKDPVPVS